MARPEPWAVMSSEPLQDCNVFGVRRTLARSPRTGELDHALVVAALYFFELGGW